MVNLIKEVKMHSVHLYIQETLESGQLGKVRDMLSGIPHVVDVGFSDKAPHDVYVDFEAHQHDIPMQIIQALEKEGLHPDIVSA
jgi:hypothetical protein